jgi:hypothetical protein
VWLAAIDLICSQPHSEDVTPEETQRQFIALLEDAKNLS